MFRGISGSEHSRKFHRGLELYRRLDMPCLNPLLSFTKQEILEIIRDRYGLPLNPIYEHMDRSYCICCYTSDKRRQAYSQKCFPDVHDRYYAQIEELLFDSGLVQKTRLKGKHKTKAEKLDRHGFVHWRRQRAQNVVGAVKWRPASGVVAYRVRKEEWIQVKHLEPARGRWVRRGSDIRFWGIREKLADVLIRRMLNCLDCGFCVVECFPCRRFDRATKALQIDGCIQCGQCVKLKFCMGWRHRFWRRVIVEAPDGTPSRRERAVSVSC